MSFNPHSNGRASPVHDGSGKVDPAMYAAVDAPSGGVIELVYHTVLKITPTGGTVSHTVFDFVCLVELRVVERMDLVSIATMEHKKIIRPNFSGPRHDFYIDTQKDAQLLYDTYASSSGLAWTSAQGLAISAVLYESRTPPDALLVVDRPWRLKDDPVLWDLTQEVLSDHDIRLSSP